MFSMLIVLLLIVSTVKFYTPSLETSLETVSYHEAGGGL